MNRISALYQRYDACNELVLGGVEIGAIGDPVGARFNAALRRLVFLLRDDGPGPWDDLVGASKALRWRLLTQPQPIEANPSLVRLASEVEHHSFALQGATVDHLVLEELAHSAAAIATTDPAVGKLLLRDCRETGEENCVVLASDKTAQKALNLWLNSYGIRALTIRELDESWASRNQTYVAGPPAIFPSSLVTAPITGGVNFLFPAWFSDRSVPSSLISPYAEGAIRVAARVFTEGDTGSAAPDAPIDMSPEDAYRPQPIWGVRRSGDREPTTDEVEARKVLLSGSLAMWLDDGDRIRSLDPEQPAGERVTYTEVAAVREGTYLLIRQGMTEHQTLHEGALVKLGVQAKSVESTQLVWKWHLSERLEQHSMQRVTTELRSIGVVSADRARAWTNSNLIRPNRDQDFKLLLRWLGIHIQPTFDNASLLRRLHYQVSAEVRKHLEAAAATAEIGELDITGQLSLNLGDSGFRGMMAVRVLAVAPYAEIVPRREARIPFEDRGGQWLE